MVTRTGSLVSILQKLTKEHGEEIRKWNAAINKVRQELVAAAKKGRATVELKTLPVMKEQQARLIEYFRGEGIKVSRATREVLVTGFGISSDEDEYRTEEYFTFSWFED